MICFVGTHFFRSISCDMWHGTYTSSCLDWVKLFILIHTVLVFPSNSFKKPWLLNESGRHTGSLQYYPYQKDNFELPLLSRISCNKEHTYRYQYLLYIPMEKESHHHHSLEETKWLGFMWYTGSLPPRRNDRVPLRLACHNDSTPQEVWVHRKTHLNGAGTGTAGPHTIR